MFTGIIEYIGKIKKRDGNFFEITCDGDLLSLLDSGRSVAVNGVCLTVLEKPKSDFFQVEVMPETLGKTMMDSLKSGDRVNLELPMTARNFLSGHIVQGHVDGVGVVDEIKFVGNSRIIKVKVGNLARYMASKGSVAVNGISLTVIDAGDDFFTVGIIPFTWENTMLNSLVVSDRVNIETDIIAKYVERLINYEKK